MAQFQLLTCDIALGGDKQNVVARHDLTPITYPEYLVLKFVHGGSSDESPITNIFACGTVEREPAEEMARLLETYGAVVRNTIFTGQQPLPLGDEKFRPAMLPGEGRDGTPATLSEEERAIIEAHRAKQAELAQPGGVFAVQTERARNVLSANLSQGSDAPIVLTGGGIPGAVRDGTIPIAAGGDGVTVDPAIAEAAPKAGSRKPTAL
jgi:hypothetical protein